MNRRSSQKKVAESRASFFARNESTSSSNVASNADAKAATISAASTTPTGRLRYTGAGSKTKTKRDENEDEDKESWPGPWSTAKSMIEKRESAKRARQELLKESDMADSKDENDKEGIDEYDIELSKLNWQPRLDLRYFNKLQTLSDICLETIVKHIDQVDYQVLHCGAISNQTIDQLSLILCRQKKLNEAVLLNTLAAPGASSLNIPDCSLVDEDALISSIERLCGMKAQSSNINTSISSSKQSKLQKNEDEEVIIDMGRNDIIQRLILRNCGRCFTDKTAAALCNHIDKLEELVITGCYKLSPDGMSHILESCWRSLHTLDISSNNRFSSANTMLSIVKNCKILQSLTLDYMPIIKDHDILTLLPSNAGDELPLPLLNAISLMGLAELTDASLVPLISFYGENLESFSISSAQCKDDFVVELRSSCHTIRKLRLEELIDLSPEACTGLFISHPSSMDSYGDIGPLELVSLHGTCEGVVDEVVISLCQQYGRTLTSLTLNGCQSLTNRAAVAIYKHCVNLQNLDVSFVRGFSESVMGQLIDSCLSLKRLAIWGCTQYSTRLINGSRNDFLEIIGYFNR